MKPDKTLRYSGIAAEQNLESLFNFNVSVNLPTLCFFFFLKKPDKEMARYILLTSIYSGLTSATW